MTKEEIEKLRELERRAVESKPDGIEFSREELDWSDALFQHGSKLLDAAEENARLREALELVARRHEGWELGLGPCVCEGHIKARAALAAIEGEGK